MTIKEKEVVIGSSKKRKIKIVTGSTKASSLVDSKLISQSDVLMDIRARETTKAAINRAKICNKPIAKYDASKKKAYIEQPDGGRSYLD